MRHLQHCLSQISISFREAVRCGVIECMNICTLTTISHFDTHANFLITNSSHPHTLLFHSHYYFCTWTWQLKILTSALSLHSRFQAAWMLFYRSRCVPYLTSFSTSCTHCEHSQALSIDCSCTCVSPEPERVYRVAIVDTVSFFSSPVSLWCSGMFIVQ